MSNSRPEEESGFLAIISLLSLQAVNEKNSVPVSYARTPSHFSSHFRLQFPSHFFPSPRVKLAITRPAALEHEFNFTSAVCPPLAPSLIRDDSLMQVWEDDETLPHSAAMDLVSTHYYRSFCGRELIADMVLRSAEVSRSENGQWWSGRRCPKAVVQVVFDFCLFLEVGHVEKYAAVELFERFSAMHIKLVRRELHRANLSPNTRGQTRRNLQKQVVLRLVSCITIVHKFHSSNIRNNRCLQNFLSKCLSLVRVVAPKCTSEILFKSEFRVLQV